MVGNFDSGSNCVVYRFDVCHVCNKKSKNRLIENLKRFTFEITGFNEDLAKVTIGGIDLKNINPKTMESKLVKGLFFAGEVLDIDAYTGGYNLQLAFSTGYAAGCNS